MPLVAFIQSLAVYLDGALQDRYRNGLVMPPNIETRANVTYRQIARLYVEASQGFMTDVEYRLALFNHDVALQEGNSGAKTGCRVQGDGGAIVQHDSLPFPLPGGIGRCPGALLHPSHNGQDGRHQEERGYSQYACRTAPGANPARLFQPGKSSS